LATQSVLKSIEAVTFDIWKSFDMRLHILSDLHLETGPYRIPDGVDYDILVAAGDIGEGLLGVEFLKGIDKPVVYVPGNHEYYSQEGKIDRDDRLQQIREAAAGSNIHVLQDESVTLYGIRFLGATLWTNCGNGNPCLLRYADETQDDYRHIGSRNWYRKDENRVFFLEAGRKVWPENSLQTAIKEARFHPLVGMALHEQSLLWLDDQLRRRFDGPTVVVTHHHPSFESLRRSGTDDALLRNEQLWCQSNATHLLYRITNYASDLDSLLFRHKGRIALWGAGHIHAHLDYCHLGVRMVCNPRGAAPTNANGENPYQGKMLDFDPEFIVELINTAQASH
jgi:DNA repair exonuclease SbcCD nuclease subunit